MAETPPPPDLIASAAREARNMFILGLVCVPGGALLTAIGAVATCFLFLGPLVVLAGMVMVPIGAYQWYNPLSHSSLRRLGPTPEARSRAIDEIERELRSPDAESYTLASGDFLTATPHWLVRHGSNLFLTATRDVLWAYKLVTTRKRYGITVSTTVQVVLKTRHEKQELPASEANTPEIIAFIHRSAPAAFYGYDAQRERMSDAALAKLVDDRWASLGDNAVRRQTEPAAIGMSSSSSSSSSSIPGISTSSPIPGLSSPSATSDKGNKGTLIVGGLLAMFVLLGCCAAICGGSVYFSQKEKAQRQALAPACSGQPVAAAAAEPPGPGAHVAVFERDSSGWTPKLTSLPGFAAGDTTEQTSFVLCLDDAEDIVAETCDYDAGLTVTRKRSHQFGELVNARTGQGYGRQEVYGEMPENCPDTISSSRTISGSDVSLDDWTPYVKGWLGG